MRMFVDTTAVYLYPKTVDFRMQFNGLALIVEQQLNEPLMSGALFVFTNRTRKRLEKEIFKWPNSTQSSISLSEQQLNSLLGGFDIHGHQPLFYASAGL